MDTYCQYKANVLIFTTVLEHEHLFIRLFWLENHFPYKLWATIHMSIQGDMASDTSFHVVQNG